MVTVSVSVSVTVSVRGGIVCFSDCLFVLVASYKVTWFGTTIHECPSALVASRFSLLTCVEPTGLMIGSWVPVPASTGTWPMLACWRVSGLELVADVAMGETPTYGKKEVKLSPVGRQLSNGSRSLSRGARQGKHHGNSNGYVRGSAANGPDADADAETADGEEAVPESKCVEWYGAIRVLVFVRKGTSSAQNR